MKSYTDIEQSKKLAEILPIESADMVIWGKDLDAIVATNAQKLMKGLKDRKMNYIPCWSLAALLSILAKQDFTIKSIGNEFNIDIPIRHCKIWFSSLLDAAFEMICWLKENNKI